MHKIMYVWGAVSKVAKKVVSSAGLPSLESHFLTCGALISLCLRFSICKEGEIIATISGGCREDKCCDPRKALGTLPGPEEVH